MTTSELIRNNNQATPGKDGAGERQFRVIINRETPISDKNLANEVESSLPEWFKTYKKKLHDENTDLEEEIKNLSKLKESQLIERLGGKIQDLPYEVLQMLFVDGSDHDEVADVLRKKREGYLKSKPDYAERFGKGFIVGFDGRIWSVEQWSSMTPSEKRGVMVGSTCFHYESGTPGMSSEPGDHDPNKPKVSQ